jgi:CRISPR-associated protein Csd1
MSWVQKLSETYNNCEAMIGYSTDESKRPLLPICHMTAQAHITVVIDKDGNLLKGRSRVVTDTNNAATIIPCTEGSGSRAGTKPECHPLCDQLQYVAGDFTEYGGTVTSGFVNDPEEPYRNYIKVLTDWCQSKFGHPKAQAVLKYVKKKTLIRDLRADRILFIGQDGKFLSKREKQRQKSVSDIFSVVGSQEHSFIRWEVEVPGDFETKTWMDKTLWNRWIQYYFSTKAKEPLCYVKGENDFLSLQHPKYIRVKGDGAKLISSNDTSGFTFRGRFLTAEQACGVGFEVSQKAHNALIWLISRQGKTFFVKGNGGRKEPGLTVVAWATSGKMIPKVTDDSLSILGFDDLPDDEPFIVSTAQDVAIRFRNRMLGYSSELGNTDNITVMGLDSASKGRLAITYYREDLTAPDFLQRIERWHKSCKWIHEYRYKDIQLKETGKIKRVFQPFIGAPAPINIVEAAYGGNADDKLKKATLERLLPCIVEGQQIPRDIVESAVRRTCNRTSMDEWEWNKTLSIACGLYKKLEEEEGYSMALDEDRNTRDYLYGRLLALADSLEQWALSKAGEDRQTNAARLMQRFAEHPYTTWRSIELSLSPYKARLGALSSRRQSMIDKVKSMFNTDDFINDKKLSGEFLLAYSCQRQALRLTGASKTTTESEPDALSEPGQ